MKIDFHSHILPGIDDGSRSVEESIKILDAMAADGVDTVIATPHFYCSKTSIHRFLDKRNAAYERLKAAMRPDHPKVLLGAEVLYHPALIGKDALKRLAIQGTGYMLLEMPYTKLDDTIIEGVDKIASELDVKVIVAHIERYLSFTSFKSLMELMELNVIGQINAESLTHMRSRSSCFKLIKNGCVQLLGTDMHRIDRGDAMLGEGLDILENKFGKDLVDAIAENGKRVLQDCDIGEFFG